FNEWPISGRVVCLSGDCERAFVHSRSQHLVGLRHQSEVTKPEKEFIVALKEIAEPGAVKDVSRYFHPDPNAGSDGNKILSVSIGKIFPVAKRFTQMSLGDIERLLDSPYYEVRMGAVSIMDFQARSKSTTPEQRKELFDLYVRRHDRINNWDLVDRAAPHV